MSGGKLLAGILLCAFAAGCASVPSLEGPRKVPVAEIARHVECELRGAVVPYKDDAFLKKMWVAFSLLLKVDEGVNASPGATFIKTVSGGVLNMGLATDTASKSTRTARLEFEAVKVEELAALGACETKDGYGLQGDLKIADWVTRSVQSADLTEKFQPKIFSQSVSFEVKLGGSLSPHLKLTDVNTTGLFGGARTDTHTLSIAFSPDANKFPGLSAVPYVIGPGKEILIVPDVGSQLRQMELENAIDRIER